MRRLGGDSKMDKWNRSDWEERVQLLADPEVMARTLAIDAVFNYYGWTFEAEHASPDWIYFVFRVWVPHPQIGDKIAERGDRLGWSHRLELDAVQNRVTVLPPQWGEDWSAKIAAWFWSRYPIELDRAREKAKQILEEAQKEAHEMEQEQARRAEVAKVRIPKKPPMTESSVHAYVPRVRQDHKEPPEVAAAAPATTEPPSPPTAKFLTLTPRAGDWQNPPEELDMIGKPGRPGLSHEELIDRLAKAQEAEEIKAHDSNKTWKEIAREIGWKYSIKLLEDARHKLERASENTLREVTEFRKKKKKTK